MYYDASSYATSPTPDAPNGPSPPAGSALIRAIDAPPLASGEGLDSEGRELSSASRQASTEHAEASARAAEEVPGRTRRDTESSLLT